MAVILWQAVGGWLWHEASISRARERDAVQVVSFCLQQAAVVFWLPQTNSEGKTFIRI